MGDGDWAKCLKLTNKMFEPPDWSIAGIAPRLHFYGFRTCAPPAPPPPGTAAPLLPCLCGSRLVGAAWCR